MLTFAVPSQNFSFRCHRDGANVYSVNALSFHPIHGTFSTAGSDGTFNFWDKDSKQRLKSFSNVGGPIPCTTFNRNGSIFAYAVSYDWSKVGGFRVLDMERNKHARLTRLTRQGYTGRTMPTVGGQNADRIFLHAAKDEDVRPRVLKKR